MESYADRHKYLALVGSDGEAARQIARLRDVPRIYNFEFTLNDSLQKMCLVAVSEEEAERLFYEILTPAKPHIDSRGSSGVLDYIVPDLIKYYRRKVGTQLIDKYHVLCAMLEHTLYATIWD